MAFWDPLGTCSALSSIQDRTRPKKGAKKDFQHGGFLELFWPYVRQVGAHMEDQVAKKSIQKAFKTSFAHILKTSKSIEFLMVFGGPSCQVELKMAALRGSGEPLGTH